MTKADLIKTIAIKTDFTQKNIREVLTALEETVFEHITDEDGIAVISGVKLGTKYVPARTGRNPRTGEPLDIPAHNRAFCKLGKAVKDAANK